VNRILVLGWDWPTEMHVMQFWWKSRIDHELTQFILSICWYRAVHLLIVSQSPVRNARVSQDCRNRKVERRFPISTPEERATT